MDGLEDTTETEKYTIIDAIAYDGEYLEVNPSDTIPLGNNKENDGVYLQFVVKMLTERKYMFHPSLIRVRKLTGVHANILIRESRKL